MEAGALVSGMAAPRLEAVEGVGSAVGWSAAARATASGTAAARVMASSGSEDIGVRTAAARDEA